MVFLLFVPNYCSLGHRTLLERMDFSTFSLVSRATDWMTKGAPYWIPRVVSLHTPPPPLPHL